MLRCKRGQPVLIGCVILFAPDQAYGAPSANFSSVSPLSSNSIGTIPQELIFSTSERFLPLSSKLLNLKSSPSANLSNSSDLSHSLHLSTKLSIAAKQVPENLNKAIAPISQPTTKSIFGSISSSRKAADLRVFSQPAPIAFSANKLKHFKTVDIKARDQLAKSLETEIQSPLAIDPELGNLQLQEASDRPIIPGSSSDPNSPFIPPVPVGCDPELGCLRLQSPLITRASPPVMYLLPRLDIFRSNNILSGLNPVEDGLIRPAISLLVLPALGSSTYLNASAEGAFNQYFSLTQFNYSELKLKAGIFQRLSPTMSAEIGWTNQQFFIANDQPLGLRAGTRFLNEHSVRFELSRQDQLAKKLSLNSFYQFRVSFTQPSDRSRIVNVVFLSLNYALNPRVQLGLDYQFASANFTVQPRTDLYHQVLGRVSYSAFRNGQVSLYGGFSKGSSTESAINFNSFLLGISLSVSLVIF